MCVYLSASVPQSNQRFCQMMLRCNNIAFVLWARSATFPIRAAIIVVHLAFPPHVRIVCFLGSQGDFPFHHAAPRIYSSDSFANPSELLRGLLCILCIVLPWLYQATENVKATLTPESILRFINLHYEPLSCDIGMLLYIPLSP